jgi:hypothetical protein
MHFEIVGSISDIEIIAHGPSIRILPMLRKRERSMAKAEGCCHGPLN